jgi:hypothetical protein
LGGVAGGRSNVEPQAGHLEIAPIARVVRRSPPERLFVEMWFAGDRFSVQRKGMTSRKELRRGYKARK